MFALASVHLLLALPLVKGDNILSTMHAAHSQLWNLIEPEEPSRPPFSGQL